MYNINEALRGNGGLSPSCSFKFYETTLYLVRNKHRNLMLQVKGHTKKDPVETGSRSQNPTV